MDEEMKCRLQDVQSGKRLTLLEDKETERLLREVLSGKLTLLDLEMMAASFEVDPTYSGEEAKRYISILDAICLAPSVIRSSQPYSAP